MEDLLVKDASQVSLESKSLEILKSMAEIKWNQLENTDFWDKVRSQQSGFNQDLAEIIEEDIRAQYEHIENMKSVASNCHRELQDIKNRIEAFFKNKLRKFQDEITKMKGLTNIDENVIKLNVGGTLFTTFKSTLCADSNSMLAAMFSGVHQITKSTDGSYFIDADGKYFRHILNYLRGKINHPCNLPKDHDALKALKAEADYFQMNGLTDLINAALKKGPQMEQAYFDKFFVFDDIGYHPITHVSFNGLNMDGISFARIHFNFSVSFIGASLVGASFRYSTFRSRSLEGEDILFSARAIFSSHNYTSVDFSSADLKECDFRDAVLNFEHNAVVFKQSKNIEEAFFDSNLLAAIKSHNNLS